MANIEKRLSALEQGAVNPDLAMRVIEREDDVSAWLLSSEGDTTEKAAVWDHILVEVDGLSRGLHSEGNYHG